MLSCSVKCQSSTCVSSATRRSGTVPDELAAPEPKWLWDEEAAATGPQAATLGSPLMIGTLAGGVTAAAALYAGAAGAAAPAGAAGAAAAAGPSPAIDVAGRAGVAAKMALGWLSSSGRPPPSAMGTSLHGKPRMPKSNSALHASLAGSLRIDLAKYIPLVVPRMFSSVASDLPKNTPLFHDVRALFA